MNGGPAPSRSTCPAGEQDLAPSKAPPLQAPPPAALHRAALDQAAGDADARPPADADPLDPLAREAARERRRRGADPAALAAFEALAAPLRPRLLQALRGRTPDAATAEDVVQDSLLKAWRHLDRWDPGRRFLPWALTIAFRTARDHARSHAREHRRRRAATPTLRLAGRRTAPLRPDHALQQVLEADDLWTRAAAHLTHAAWTDLWLRHGEGLEPTEIAQATGRTALAVRASLHRAHRTLRRKLDQPDHHRAPALPKPPPRPAPT